MIRQEIAVPLAIIFRTSLDTRCIPHDWKTANVTPLFKKGSRSQVENYRPVSLTSQLCKVLESVIRDALVSHLDKNSLLNSSQHGFRKGLSCSSNLLTFLESVTAHIDNKSVVDTLYLDLAKVFDKVPPISVCSRSWKPMAYKDKCVVSWAALFWNLQTTGPVSSISDCHDLQRNLNTVCSWAKKWQMEFNVSKCKTVHYGKNNWLFGKSFPP